MAAPVIEALEWEGGTLDDLITMMTGPALAVRVEVRTPASGRHRVVGEVHIVAGGVADAFAGQLRGDDALAQLRGVSPLSFRVEPRLPNPKDGGLLIPGPNQGTLQERPPVELMRYCEDYVLTCVLELTKGEDRATLEYQRGDITKTTVNGSDAPERLPEVIGWTEGRYRLVLPRLAVPDMPGTEPAPAPAAAAARPAEPVAVQTASAPAARAAAATTPAPKPAEPARATPAAQAPRTTVRGHEPVRKTPVQPQVTEPSRPRVASPEPARAARPEPAAVKPAVVEAAPVAAKPLEAERPAAPVAKVERVEKPEPAKPAERAKDKDRERDKPAARPTASTKSAKAPKEAPVARAAEVEPASSGERSLVFYVAIGLGIGGAIVGVYWALHGVLGG